MKVKRVFLLSLFVVLAANAWTLDLRAIAYRAFMYLGSPMPEKANVEGNIGRFNDNQNGDYLECWAFQLNENQRVKLAQYEIHDIDRKKLNSILSDFVSQVYINGYKFFLADADYTAYITNDGPFSMVIMIGNSIITSKSGNPCIKIVFIRLADFN